jgi:type IV pilus assembly protein PilB
MVGEIRDNETAALAVNAALTGHLVLSTLHTNSAAGAVPRLMDMKIEPFLLVSTINVVLAKDLSENLQKKGKNISFAGRVIFSRKNS